MTPPSQSPLTPAPTRKRLLGAAAVLVVASVILLVLGVDPVPYFGGLAVGLLLVVAIGWIAWRRVCRERDG